MIDIHCHILPNIDDGPRNELEFLEMVSEAVNRGVTHVFTTPHHLNGSYENEQEKIMEKVEAANQLLRHENIPLVILPGQEVRIHREIFTSIASNEILTYGNKGRYLLLELPSGEVPNYTHEVIYELILNGITPIIAHPERNKGFLEEESLLYEFIQEGALTQVTAGSIIGHFGRKIKSFARKMIEHQLVHFVASDAHNNLSRGFNLQEGYDHITKVFGIKQTVYFRKNSEFLLNGENISREEPLPIKKRKLGLF